MIQAVVSELLTLKLATDDLLIRKAQIEATLRTGEANYETCWAALRKINATLLARAALPGSPS
ncbi:hypothetical protein [Roseomonas indoligenes]|uniref:Uncharacterized protein n=1 Tax=Roseomonas indoligenes TaxID=2820811 RepID=A0A940MQG2_9PROT|nr:hypothetical protein [Pararoseomonas indoligenes]MBP0492123.1 hypothetical protein [Pararoseomonas indoligenes]